MTTKDPKFPTDDTEEAAEGADVGKNTFNKGLEALEQKKEQVKQDVEREGRKAPAINVVDALVGGLRIFDNQNLISGDGKRVSYIDRSVKEPIALMSEDGTMLLGSHEPKEDGDVKISLALEGSVSIDIEDISPSAYNALAVGAIMDGSEFEFVEGGVSMELVLEEGDVEAETHLGRMVGIDGETNYPLIISTEWDELEKGGFDGKEPLKHIEPGTEEYQSIINYIQLLGGGRDITELIKDKK